MSDFGSSEGDGASVAWAAGWQQGALDEAEARRIHSGPLRSIAQLIETLDDAVDAGTVAEEQAVDILRETLSD